MSLASSCALVPEMLLEAPAEAESLRIEDLLKSCAGVAFVKLYRLGCIVTIRGGQGVLIKRKEDGSWSAPSALTMMGAALGASIGIEMSDYVIFFKSEAQIDSFSTKNTGTMGVNGSLAAGTLGRSGEALISTASPEGFIVFSSTKGLYGGVSLEFSGVVVDNTANTVQYGRVVTPAEVFEEPIPSGEVFEKMYRALEETAAKSVPKSEQQEEENFAAE